MPTRIAVAMAAVLCLPTIAHAAERRLDRAFPITGSGTLNVEADGSNITVTATDGTQVVVNVLVKGSQETLDEMILTAEQSAQNVTVTAKRADGGWRHWFGSGNLHGEVSVQVPRNYRIDVKTSGGNVVARGLRGDAIGRTSGGDIKVEDVQGTVRMKTSGGNMDAARITGSTDLNTSGGNIQVRSLTGDLSVKTSGGSIKLAEITGPVSARTSSGSVIATGIKGDADLQTSGGDVRGDKLDGRIRAHTSGGNVHVTLEGTNRGIDASTSGGDIVVQIAKDTPAYLNAATSGGSVTSEIPVSVTTSGERKLQGPINGGGEAILARTSGGNIRIKVRP